MIALAEWRAAFIESCDELHLSRMPTFAAVISIWGRLDPVRDAFQRSSPGGRRRLRALLQIADDVSDLDELAERDPHVTEQLHRCIGCIDNLKTDS